MRILVTGGCGFIGSNYIIDSVINNKFIINIDKLTYAGRKENLLKIKDEPNYNFIEGDICDSNLIYKTLKKYEPNLIVNFAAESHVDRSIDNPLSFVQTNILGTASLLSASLKYWEDKKDIKLLHISTDEVFGSLGINGSFNEQSRYNPSSPYSASKASSDHLVNAWYNTYRLPVLITNCSNNYGPYQFPEKLIPLMITNSIDEQPLPIYGEGKNIRDWLFVEDHCRAINLVLQKGTIGETYNIGGNNELSNNNIVKTICNNLDNLIPRKHNKSYSDLIKFVTDRPGHDFRYAINSSKIKNDLGWEPKETFETGIIKTIKWYLDNEDWWRSIQKNVYNQERIGILNKIK